MGKTGEIIEGWTNLIFKDKVVERVARARMNICNTCVYHSRYHETNRPDAHCIECGCPFAAKTRSMQSACPIGKWGADKVENYENK